MGRKPTHKTIKFSGMVFIKAKNGKVLETWDEWDRYGVLAQIDL